MYRTIYNHRINEISTWILEKIIFTIKDNFEKKIWIDNCSNDGTFEYLKSKKDNQTVLISEKDKGIFYAFNKGIKLAKGNIIGFLHSDDFFSKRNVISNIVKHVNT